MDFYFTWFTVIVLCLTSIVVQSFGELLLLRHPTNGENSRKLTCVAEGEDSALIWNYNPIGRDPNNGSNIFANFVPKKPSRKNDPECAIWKANVCFVKWQDKNGWTAVKSSIEPMSPVLDFRWEDFSESVGSIALESQRYQHMGELSKYSASTVFSVRAKRDVHVFLCESISPMARGQFCFWIILGGWNGMKSVIRTCRNGAPIDRKALRQGDCVNEASFPHEAEEVVHQYEWRTFTIKWITEEKTIQVFRDTDHNIPLIGKKLTQWGHASHLSMRYDKDARIRFHFYEYLLTKDVNVITVSETFHHGEENFCLELLVGLCPQCVMNVNLVDEYNREFDIGSIVGMENDTHNELLTWRLVRLNKKLESFEPANVKLKIQTSYAGVGSSHRWAIDHFRVCESVGQIRQSSIIAPKNRYTWHEVRCQKLSYGNSAVLDSLLTNDSPTRQFQQYIHNLEDRCGSACTSLGKYWSLCYQTGCTCARGFKGRDCNEECSDGHYGYNCDAECKPCNIGFCDKLDGLCDAEARIIEDGEKPEVKNITDTTATVYQKINLKADIILHVRIAVRKELETSPNYFETYLPQSGVPLTYLADLSNLTLGTNYSIHAIVYLDSGKGHKEIRGPETHFVTTCYGNPHFNLIPGEKSLRIEMSGEATCQQGDLPKYLVHVYDVAKQTIERQHESASFPSTYHNLRADTEYSVIIFNVRVTAKVFSSKFRTPESAPSKVEELNVKLVTITEVELQWDPPKEKNGVLRRYTVFITEAELLGCKHLNRWSPQQNKSSETDKRTVSFSDLHPYASYTATVIAHTTIPGSPNTITFQTPASDIPTSKVSGLTIDAKNTLKWDAPTDCTTITGPTKYVKLFFTKVSDPFPSSTYTIPISDRNINLTTLDLMHYTRYRVRVHVIRDHDRPENSTNYQELTWRTPPAAPSAVKNLEIYDADPDTGISLRWEPPNPANGDIQSYRVLIYKAMQLLSTNTLDVPEGGLECKPGKNYVCYENLIIPSCPINNYCQIWVYGMNKEVTQAGLSATVPITSEIFDRPPSKPENLTSISKGNGTMSLTWAHPSITPTKITRFYIQAYFVSTELITDKANKLPITKQYDIQENQEVYSVDLNLWTSTVYDVSVVAVNKRNSNSKRSEIRISVPSGVAFASKQEVQVTQRGTFIEVTIPTVVNATQDTAVSIIVQEYERFRENQASSSFAYSREWVASTYKEYEKKSAYLPIEIGESREDDSKHFIHFGGTYVIIAMVKDFSSKLSVNRTSSPITLYRDEQNLAWLVIFPIIAISLLLLFFGYRKRGKFSQLRKKNSNGETVMAPWNQLKSPTPSPEVKSSRLSTEENTADPVPYNPLSCPVPIAKFEEYVKDAIERGLLVSQCENFERGLKKPCEYGRLPDNKSKNRYRDLITYDESRVVLEKIPDNSFSDYINASYIPGYRKKRAYIATQGPLPSTVKDFWRMIWQEDVRVICMLANVIEGGRKKCEQYWPSIGTETDYDGITVSNPNHEVFVDYTVRTFIVSLGNESRTVMHLHYTGWPDHGVPRHIQSLVPYLKRLQKIEIGNGPIVVHCSAGVGRTGTIILCDTCLRRAEKEKVVDLPAVTIRMRKYRANMVDNAQQYLLAHLLILEYTISDQTEIPCNDILKTEIEELRKRLPSHVKRLNDTVWQDRALHDIATPKSGNPEEMTTNGIAENSSVNPDVPSSESSALFDVESKYIRTIGVDGVKMKNQYLACRLPSRANHSDLWRIIDEENVELIIILQSPDPNDSSYCEVIPSESSLVEIGGKKSPNEDEEHFTIDRLVLTGDEERPQPLTVLTCTGWKCDKNGEPPPASALVSLWIASEKISRQESPTLVLCQDGVTGCGLYLALSFLLEQMAVERVCDVISAVRAVRKFKPEFVQSLAQFEYLYDAAVKYHECFQTYANFS